MLTATIERHWQEHRPKLYRELQASGRLHRAIQEAANRAFDVETAALHQGLNPDQARELARQE